MTHKWWETATIYQIYARSFQDSDGDGIGDLDGIRQRLDYLVWLGVDAIWISPIYPSPMHDFGYDVTDDCGIDPIFGSLESFDLVIDEAHTKQLKVVLDFVPNHTSIEHPWFIASRRSRADPKRDWYIWRDADPDGGPPNNWISNFGGSAWTWDEATGQYYYHAYLAEQPDLNWRNPNVRAAMHEALRFWLRRGVDGFRVDVMWHLIKDAAFRDNPPNPAWTTDDPQIDRLLQTYSTDQPEVHGAIAGMRQVLEEFDNRVLIGEIYLPVERLVAYYGKNLTGAHLPFNFQLLNTAWTAPHIAELIENYETALPDGGWPNWVLSNHDRPRVAARVGPEQARVAAMLLLTLRGTPTLYYGDEIGMHQVAIAPDQVRDPFEKNVPGIGVGRDGCRTPMQWDATAYAGFSTSAPRLPLADDFLHENVVNLEADSRSILNLYKALLDLRKRLPHLVSGEYVPVAADGDLLLYRRQSEGNAVVIALNLGAEPVSIAADAIGLGGEILLSTFLDRQGEEIQAALDLRGNEGVIIGPR